MSDDVQRESAKLEQLRIHAKQALRDRMRSVRRVLPLDVCAARSARATQRLLALPEFASAQVVIGYSALRKELDPAEALNFAAAQGKQVGLPRVYDQQLELHEYRKGDELEESGFGMLEPLESAKRIELERVTLILVPALALDDQGYRIGYGHAFYDRFLPRLPNAFAVGLAYDFQLVPELPHAAHDVPLQCVVTDTRVLRV